MAESEFPSNSKFPPKLTKVVVPDKVVEKVTTGAVIQKKRSLGSKFKEFFNINDSRSAAQYVVNDVVLPSIRNLIVDSTSRGVERLIYGDNSARRNNPRSPYSQSRVQYNSPTTRFSGQGRSFSLPDQPPRGAQQIRPNHTLGEIILSSRQEAEIVLERLTDIVDKYETASVGDLNELVGLPSAYVDAKWGWTNLAFSNVRQTRDGFVLNLPPPEPI